MLEASATLEADVRWSQTGVCDEVGRLGPREGDLCPDDPDVEGEGVLAGDDDGDEERPSASFQSARSCRWPVPPPLREELAFQDASSSADESSVSGRRLSLAAAICSSNIANALRSSGCGIASNSRTPRAADLGT